MFTKEAKFIETLKFHIGNLQYAAKRPTFTEFNKGRLEAYKDCLQMLTGDRGDDLD